jgi:hypothetical protein
MAETGTEDAGRLPVALKLRMSKINRDIAKFIAIHQRILKQNASGKTPEDQISNAKSVFSTVHKVEFLFTECWKVMKDAPRFRSLINSTSASNSPSPRPLQRQMSSQSNPESTEVSLESDNASSSRPHGSKRAKTNAMEANSIASEMKQYHQDVLAKLDKRNDLLELALLSTKDEDLNPAMHEIMRLKRAQYLEKLNQ